MENKGNKLTNVLSLVGIVGLFGIMIFFIIFNANKNKQDDEPYAPFETTVAPTTAPEVEEEPSSTISDISLLLDTLSADINAFLQSKDPSVAMYSTPGLKLDYFGSIKSQIGTGRVLNKSYWKSDTDSATVTNKGNYLLNLSISTDYGDKKLYVYVYTDIRDGQFYVSKLQFTIGDF